MNHQPTNQLTNQPTNQPTNRFTLETALWIWVVALALALRLLRLGAAPLTTGEAREAMLAWQAANGQGMPTAGYTPLLLAANAALFVLSGANDTLARLWPALLGSALVLMPFLFRQRIGRVGALAAGVYLAVSPTALFAARQLDGAVAVALGVLAWLGGLIRFLDTGRRPWLTLAAGGLALAGAAGPSACGLVLTLVLAWLGLAWAWFGKPLRELWATIRPQLLHMLVVFVLVALALSTGMGWNLAGLGALGDLAADWFRRFAPTSGFVASPVVLLAVYEPLALLFGVGGLVMAVRRARRLGMLLGLWAGLQVVLLSLMPGRLPLDTLGIVLPLALLTGYAVEVLAQDLQGRRIWQGECLYVLAFLVLCVHLYLRLASYALYGQVADLFLALLTLVLQILLAAILVMAAQTMAVLRSVVLGAGLVLLVVTLSTEWGLAYVRPSDPRELLTREPTADAVRDLVGTLRDLSWRKTGMPQTLAFAAATSSDPVAAWYLRDFDNVRWIEEPGQMQAGEIATAFWPDWTPLADTYAGQKFALQHSWDMREARCAWGESLPCSEFIRWLLFRRGTLLTAHSLALWVPVNAE